MGLFQIDPFDPHEFEQELREKLGTLGVPAKRDKKASSNNPEFDLNQALQQSFLDYSLLNHMVGGAKQQFESCSQASESMSHVPISQLNDLLSRSTSEDWQQIIRQHEQAAHQHQTEADILRQRLDPNPDQNI